MNTLVQSIKDTFTKEEAGVSTPGVSTLAGGVGAKTAKLTKPAKVPLWTKDMSLETFAKQLQTWTDIFDDIPEYVKFQDLIEGLKNNKEIKGLPRYVGEQIIPVLENKTDQTMKRVLELLDIKYEQTWTEKIEEIVEDWMRFRDDQFEDDGELLLGMK